MDRDQTGGTSGGSDDVSYNDRGADNVEDLTRADENMMDRLAQSGKTGAFGEGDATDAAQRREDAEAAFGGEAEDNG